MPLSFIKSHAKLQYVKVTGKLNKSLGLGATCVGNYFSEGKSAFTKARETGGFASVYRGVLPLPFTTFLQEPLLTHLHKENNKKSTSAWALEQPESQMIPVWQ